MHSMGQCQGMLTSYSTSESFRFTTELPKIPTPVSIMAHAKCAAVWKI